MRRWAGDAAAVLYWSPDQFWACHLADLMAAFDGTRRHNSVGPDPLTRDEMDELIAAYPDGGSIRKDRRASPQ